jgi:hypothetical protein
MFRANEEAFITMDFHWPGDAALMTMSVKCLKALDATLYYVEGSATFNDSGVPQQLFPYRRSMEARGHGKSSKDVPAREHVVLNDKAEDLTVPWRASGEFRTISLTEGYHPEGCGGCIEKVYVEGVQKYTAALSLTNSLMPGRVIVFVKNPKDGERLVVHFGEQLPKVRASMITCNLADRASVVESFDKGDIDVIVTTRLRLRGCDVRSANAVILFDVLPPMEFVHCAGRSPHMMTIVTNDKLQLMREIEERWLK